MNESYFIHLMNCFPGSFINHNFELIADKKTNQYVCLKGCKDANDIKCRLLEQLSRAAYKTQPYQSERANNKLHTFIANGINEFLGTNFTEDDFDLIYTYLGNSCNPVKTKKFVMSGYDMKLLKEGERK